VVQFGGRAEACKVCVPKKLQTSAHAEIAFFPTKCFSNVVGMAAVGHARAWWWCWGGDAEQWEEQQQKIPPAAAFAWLCIRTLLGRGGLSMSRWLHFGGNARIM